MEMAMKSRFMQKLSALIFTGLLINSSGALAVSQWIALAGGSETGLHPYRIRSSINFIAFNTTEIMPTNLGCETNDVYIIPSANDSKSALSILLTAYTTGQTIAIYVNGCDKVAAQGGTGRPIVTDVLLK
jgi:hypothetical protein